MKTKTRYGLLLSETKNSDGFYHLDFHVVTIGPTAEDRRWFDQYPDSKLISETAIRNPRAEDGALHLQDFRIRSQGENAQRDRGLYAWSYEYRNVFSVNTSMARRMYKTLAAVDRAMSKSYGTFGNADSYGAYVARVAQAIKADSIVIAKSNVGWSYSENEYRFLDIADGVAEINHRVATWQNEHKKEAVEA